MEKNGDVTQWNSVGFASEKLEIRPPHLNTRMGIIIFSPAFLF